MIRGVKTSLLAMGVASTLTATMEIRDKTAAKVNFIVMELFVNRMGCDVCERKAEEYTDRVVGVIYSKYLLRAYSAPPIGNLGASQTLWHLFLAASVHNSSSTHTSGAEKRQCK